MAAHQRKKWEIVKNTRREDFEYVEVGKRRLKFGSHGAMIVHDAGEAAEIKARYQQERGEVVVVEVESERGGARQFTIPEMPWRTADASQKKDRTTVPNAGVGKRKTRSNGNA